MLGKTYPEAHVYQFMYMYMLRVIIIPLWSKPVSTCQSPVSQKLRKYVIAVSSDVAEQ